jgi:hypothetical protein
MRLGRAQHSEEGSLRSGKPKEQFGRLDSDIAGEGNAQEFVVSYDNHTIIPQTDMKSLVESWQEQARKISATAGILTGGDGSARRRKGLSTVLTDGGSAVLASRLSSAGKTIEHTAYKFCALVATLTGLWNLPEATLVQSKLTFWRLWFSCFRLD